MERPSLFACPAPLRSPAAKALSAHPQRRGRLPSASGPRSPSASQRAKTALRTPKRPFGASALHDPDPARTVITKSYLQIIKYTKTMNVICIFFALRTPGDGETSALPARKPAGSSWDPQTNGRKNETQFGKETEKSLEKQQFFTESGRNYKNAKDF